MEHQIDNDISLVPISMAYAEAIFTHFDKEVIRYLPLENPPAQLAETKAFIAHSLEQIQQGNDLVWVILYKNDFAGCCGIHTIQSREPHFGLWIKTAAQGKGIGKRLVPYMLQWGITHLDVDFIKYPVDQQNTHSIKLIQDLGLTLGDQYPMGESKKLMIDEYRIYKP